MRGFIVLCLLATAFADKLAYNYQPVPHSIEGLSFTPGASSVGAHHGISPSPEQVAPVASTRSIASAQTLAAPVAPAPIAPAQIAPAPIAPAPVAPAPAPAPAQAPAPAPVVTEYQKEFYTYTAPQADFDDAAGQEDIANSAKKSLRVVFIKAPENKGIEKATLNLAKQAAEEKTAIYVLTKQADIGSLGQQLQSIRTQSSKPEVHFVKYRTPQDAANAQQAIQQQYESLPGSSRNSNEGSAPVLNFASQAVAAAAPAHAGPGAEYLPANAVPSQEYLPPSLRRFRN
ncbi:uncharacterized protein LOC105220390 [Zeugodacus cucurbitae]|uniref:uncharacterized protein LOC105220390 n=1 Tax=Zeugodacus cucurbitae TaxID=28588 RepID=UPI0023D8FD32|nr:uncharacterized protein LOC105220390 [Zeugodacus cucurbitae]